MEISNSPRSEDKRPNIILIDDVECEHTETEKQFIDYHFTEELFAVFCKQCNKQLTDAKAE